VPETDRIKIGIRDRINFGTLTGSTSESRPPCPGIRKNIPKQSALNYVSDIADYFCI
jgi:hypothetical protein